MTKWHKSNVCGHAKNTLRIVDWSKNNHLANTRMQACRYFLRRLPCRRSSSILFTSQRFPARPVAFGGTSLFHFRFFIFGIRIAKSIMVFAPIHPYRRPRVHRSVVELARAIGKSSRACVKCVTVQEAIWELWSDWPRMLSEFLFYVLTLLWLCTVQNQFQSYVKIISERSKIQNNSFKAQTSKLKVFAYK